MKIETSSYAKIQKETDSKEPNSRRARRPKIQTTKQLRNQGPKGQTTKSRTAEQPKKPNSQRTKHTEETHTQRTQQRTAPAHILFDSRHLPVLVRSLIFRSAAVDLGASEALDFFICCLVAAGLCHQTIVELDSIIL